MASARGGPATKVTSSTADSNAKSVREAIRIGRDPGSRVRTHASSGGRRRRRRRPAPRARPAGRCAARGRRQRGQGGDGRPADEHRGLPAAVDESAQERRGGRAADRICRADHAGDGERARQLLGMDEQRDAEHGQGQTGDDRGPEEGGRAGGGEDLGGVRSRRHCSAKVRRKRLADKSQFGAEIVSRFQLAARCRSAQRLERARVMRGSAGRPGPNQRRSAIVAIPRSMAGSLMSPKPSTN